MGRGGVLMKFNLSRFCLCMFGGMIAMSFLLTKSNPYYPILSPIHDFLLLLSMAGFIASDNK